MKSTYTGLLRQPNYRKSIAASILNRFGDSLDVVAMSWLVYQVTGNAVFSALNFMVNYFPSVVFQPFCGAVVEKKNHRLVITLCDTGRAAVTLTIAFFALKGNVSSWMILAATFMISTLEAFRQPAGTAFIPEFIRREEIENAVALNNSVSNVVVMIGMACAGIIIAAIGAPLGILIDSICIALSAVLIFLIRTAEIPKPEENGENILESLKSGLVFLKEHGNLKMLAFVAMLVNMLSVPYMSLQAVICSELLHQGPAFLSIMNVSYMVGSVIGSFFAPKVRERVKNSTLILFMVFMVGISYLLIVLASKAQLGTTLLYLIMMLLLVLIGSISGVMNVVISVLMMEHTAQDYLSRISAVFSSVAMAGQLLCSALISALLVRLDITWLFTVFSGASMVLCAVLFFMPGIRDMDT